MWGDDPTWFPKMLAGEFFHYRGEVISEESVIMTPLPIEEIKQ